MKNSQKEAIFEGKWYAHGPMRNALIAGSLTGIAFALADPDGQGLKPLSPSSRSDVVLLSGHRILIGLQ